jgi:hypothetical protein
MIGKSANEICSEIADVTRWREFTGYGILPGIESAAYVERTEDMVGSRVRVRNTDGSEHVEVIRVWDPGKRIVVELCGFTPPLSRLSTHFVEEWVLEDQSNGTLVTRKLQMFPTRTVARPFLWLISLFFRRAIALHLSDMANQTGINSSIYARGSASRDGRDKEKR